MILHGRTYDPCCAWVLGLEDTWWCTMQQGLPSYYQYKINFSENEPLTASGNIYLRLRHVYKKYNYALNWALAISQFPKGVELWFKWLFCFACLLQGFHIFCQGMLASHIHTQKNFIPRNRVMLGKVLYSQIIVYNFSQTKIIHVVYKKTYHGGLISLSKSEKYLIE